MSRSASTIECSSPVARNRCREAWKRIEAKIKGVGTLIALACMLTLEDPASFSRRWDADLHRVGPQPGGRETRDRGEPAGAYPGKEGDHVFADPCWCEAAHTVFSAHGGVDSDLRRWGVELAEHRGERGEKRAVIAVARKLARPAASTIGERGDLCAAARPSGRATLPAWSHSPDVAWSLAS